MITNLSPTHIHLLLNHFPTIGFTNRTLHHGKFSARLKLNLAKLIPSPSSAMRLLAKWHWKHSQESSESVKALGRDKPLRI